MNVRKRNAIQKSLRDYIVPIIGLLFIIILVFSVFSGNDSSSSERGIENKVGLTVYFDSPSTEAYIVYPGGNKEQINGDVFLYKGEKVIVKEGDINLSLSGIGDFILNKLGEFKYLENGNFSLYSSDLWLNSTSDIVLEMRFANILIGENSNVSFSQNEMGSTVYLLNGSAEVLNLVGESTVLAPGQKITISRLDANKEDLDLSLQKEVIDDYYKQSDWFIKNNGMVYLNSQDIESEERTASGGLDANKEDLDRLISFNNLSDESYISSDLITISGNLSDEDITKILVNGKEAIIDSETKTFKIENVSVSNRENDLVFKVYDDANDLLSKFIYTVYYEGATNVSSTTGFQVQTFDVDGSEFIFTTIKDSGVSKNLDGKTTYTTYGDFLTIYGSVLAEGIANVSVNGYTLKSFNGKSWRYHPSIINNNLSLGTNIYEIKYYDAAGNVVYTNYFTIIKKEVVEETTSQKIEIKTYSSEVEIN